jgi:hypothetical protein
LSSVSSCSSKESPDKEDDDDNTVVTPSSASTTTPLSFRDARKAVADGQKLLQEWNERWGTTLSNFSSRAANLNAYFASGPPVKKVPVPVEEEDRDRAPTREEIRTVIRNGREALLRLESIAYLDFRTVEAGDDFATFWMDAIRVVEGLHEQVARADVVLRLCSDQGSDTDTQTVPPPLANTVTPIIPGN